MIVSPKHVFIIYISNEFNLEIPSLNNFLIKFCWWIRLKYDYKNEIDQYYTGADATINKNNLDS